jgi:hypothetical protein
MPSIPATAATPAARRVRPTRPSAHHAIARKVACRPVLGSRPGPPAAVPGIRAATAARSRGLRTRHRAQADRDRGQPAAAPGRRAQTVSARTCQTLTSSRTNRPFRRAAVLLPRVARDRGEALTRAGPAPSTARLRLRPATVGLTVPAGRLTAQASATRSSTGRAGADPARTDPARTDPARAVPGAAQAGQGQGQAGLGRASTTLASRVQVSLVQRSLVQGSPVRGTTGLGRTGPSRTGREWRTMGRPPTRADRTSVSMVQGRDRTARKWVRTARKLVRTARERVSMGLAMVHMVPGRTGTALAARAAQAAVPRGRAATAPAVMADSTALGRATTARAGRTPPSMVPGWASTGRARSRTGRARAGARIRAMATGTAEDPVRTARTAASGDRGRRIPGTATRAGPGRGRRDRPDRPDRGDQGAGGLSSTGLAITTKVRIALGNGAPADLAPAGQARDPGKGSPGREAAAAG